MQYRNMNRSLICRFCLLH